MVNKGYKQSNEHKRKRSKSMKGIPKSDEYKKKLSNSHLGQTPWNKDKITLCESYQKYLTDGRPKVFCQCGCNKEIIIKKHHKHSGIPKYIRGHFINLKENRKKLGSGWNKGLRNVYSKETLDKMRKARLGIPRTKEIKEKLRIANTGKKQSKETKIKKSIATSGKNNPHYGIPASIKSGHGKRSYYNSPLQGKVCFRSSYELAYAKYLDSKKILWYYEIETFNLGDNTYTPDFFLPQFEKFIEIKGYMYPKHQEKINKFLEQYPWDLEILYKEDLIKLGIL